MTEESETFIASSSVDPEQRTYIWSDKNITQAARLLRIRYAELEPTPDNIQVMIDAMTHEFRYDPEQIKRVILAHFKKRKG
jgi:hypothetical protein